MLEVCTSDSPGLSLNDSFKRFIQKHWFILEQQKWLSLWINHWVIGSTDSFWSLADMVTMNYSQMSCVKISFSVNQPQPYAVGVIWDLAVMGKSKVFRHWRFNFWVNCFFKNNALEETIRPRTGVNLTGQGQWNRWVEKMNWKEEERRREVGHSRAH